MLIDLRRGFNEGPGNAETLIVGSGAVGLTMAVELVRSGRQVIVVEAGGRTVDAESQDLFQTAESRSLQLSGLHAGRFRALGGTTNFWGGRLIPFDPIVFERRPWVADVGWPITRQELDPYYRQGYELLGMSHHLSDEMVWERLGIAPPSLGDELDLFFGAWTPQPNFAALFGSEIETSRNLSLFLNAPVVSLDLDDARQRTLGVVVRTVAGTRKISAEHIILANGTVEIARLLKLPLADGSAPPWASNPWLGKGFVDHVDCFGGEVFPIDRRRFHDLFDNAYFDGIKYMPMMKLSEHGQRKRQLLGVGAQFLFNSRLREHLANLKLLVRSLLRGRFERQQMPDLRGLVSIMRVAGPLVFRYLRYRRMYNPVDQGIQLRLIGEQFPLQSSALYLGEKRDRLGMPIVEMDWRIDGRELEAIATLAELTTQYCERNRLATIRLHPALTARDPKFLLEAIDSYHQMGMARMADTPAAGVVNEDLKVFGTHNLYVAGAAVFPTTGFANPTFTAIALGLRLAAAISADRSKQRLAIEV
jgi:GMC oxidoreductase